MSFGNSGSGSIGLAPYWFSAFPFPPGHFNVLKVHGYEPMTGAYRWEITVTASTLLGDKVEQLAVGHEASLVIRVAGKPRVISGVIESVTFDGLRQGGEALQTTFHLVPKIALLKKEFGSRIFQNMTIPHVIREVLNEWGIPSRWHLMHPHPVKDYATQAQESTYDFIMRLLGEGGIYFSFAHGASALGGFLDSIEGLIENAALDFAGLASAAASSLTHPGETLVFGDDASTYQSLRMTDAEEIVEEVASVVGLAADIALPGVDISAELSAGVALAMHLGPSPSLSYMTADGLATTRHDKVRSFVSTRSVCSDLADYRVFDPARPETPLESRAGDLRAAVASPLGAVADLAAGATLGGAISATADLAIGASAQISATISDPLSALGSFAGSGLEMLLGLVSKRQYETYEHENYHLFPDVREVAGMAALIRRRTTRERVTAEGTSGCSALFAGARFHLERHPLPDENIEYVATWVEHFGEVGQDGAVYENRFGCVPANVTYVPLPPERGPLQVILPAIVVGAPGEEIDVDHEGRILVWFPWDRRGRGPRRSCRVRVIQFWAHASHGAHFIPRVGDEVCIGFFNGDPDQPICLGSAWNATHPPTYLLPAKKTQSGIKTQSVPGGNGYNEMRFEDEKGKEHVYFHAERDFIKEIKHDRLVTVKNDEKVLVQGNRRDEVVKNESHEVRGNRDEIVHGDTSVHHISSRVDVVEKNLDQRVTGVRTTRLENQDHLEVRGRAEHRYEDDLTTRVLKNETHIVGKHDAKASWTTRVEGVATLSAEDGLVLECPKGITIKCGKTTLRIGPDGFEAVGGMMRVAGEKGSMELGKDGVTVKSEGAHAHFGEKVLVRTSAASMAMGDEFKVDGTQILFNSPEHAEEKPPPEPKPPTEIVVKDTDGRPLPGERFVIQLDDKTERTAVTDKDGKAKLDLPSGGKVRFPSLVDPKASSEGAKWGPHVVQQGDHVEKLAYYRGVPPETVWDNAKNATLKRKRRTMKQLLPGDVIQLPEAPLAWKPLRAGTTNNYAVSIPMKDMCISIHGKDGPLRGAPYVIKGLSQREGEAPPSGETNANGEVKFTVPVTQREVSILLPRQYIEYHVGIGDLDPHNEPTGPMQRLKNLGYLAKDADTIEDITGPIAAFQHDHALPVTGRFDQATLEALEEAAGA